MGPLLALALPQGGETTRVGLTVSTKVGGAVVRARIRRLLRELFRKRRGELPAGIDLVLIARASAAESDYEALGRAFDGIARKLREMFP
jgi:ribonuclease P protein component